MRPFGSNGSTILPTRLKFLGICIDPGSFILSVPEDTLQQFITQLERFPRHKACTKREIRSLIGLLSFVTKCVPAGKFFVRLMINTSSRAMLLRRRIVLAKDFYCEVKYWLEFLPLWNETSSFFELGLGSSDCADLYTDALGKKGLGRFSEAVCFKENAGQGN